MANWIEACSAKHVANEDVLRSDQAGETSAINRSPEDKFYATYGQG